MAQSAEQVVALLVDEPLPYLGALPSHPKPAALRPTDETAVQEKRLPGTAGGRKLRVRRAVPEMVGDQLEAAANTHPYGRDGVHIDF